MVVLLDGNFLSITEPIVDKIENLSLRRNRQRRKGPEVV